MVSDFLSHFHPLSEVLKQMNLKWFGRPKNDIARRDLTLFSLERNKQKLPAFAGPPFWSNSSGFWISKNRPGDWLFWMPWTRALLVPCASWKAHTEQTDKRHQAVAIKHIEKMKQFKSMKSSQMKTYENLNKNHQNDTNLCIYYYILVTTGFWCFAPGAVEVHRGELPQLWRCVELLQLRRGRIQRLAEAGARSSFLVHQGQFKVFFFEKLFGFGWQDVNCLLIFVAGNWRI